MSDDLKEWKKLSPREKATWPASGKTHTEPQYRVEIDLPQELTDWLIENVVGNTSCVCDLEETIQTALYAFCEGKFTPKNAASEEDMQAIEAAFEKKAGH